MDHADRGGLLGGAGERGETWADIGAGTGAFTLALADLLGPGGRIVAVDRDAAALHRNGELVASRFPDVTLDSLVADFTGPLDLPELDGLVAANSLHFVPRDLQATVIAGLATYLRPAGRFVLVEYDADRGNEWGPNPFSYRSWERLAASAGLIDAVPLCRVPSPFVDGIYSAVARRA